MKNTTSFSSKPGLFRALVLGVLAFLSSTGTAAARINLVVPDDYATIQEAIDAAAVGDTILVYPGTYVENLNYMGKDVIVRSTEGYLQTTLDGNLAGTVVVFENGETRDAVLDGFTITNGVGNLRPPGGVYCGNASPTIRRCLFLGNQGSDTMGGAGGLQCGFASPEIRNCIFRRNRGGGGSNPTGPGAIKLRWDCSPNVISTVFEENRGADASTNPGAGVLHAIYDCAPVFNNCDFFRNVGGDHEMCDDAGPGVLESRETVVFLQCHFEANRAGRGVDGPGVALLSSNVSFFTSCTFVDNVGSDCATGRGGAGVIRATGASPQIDGCEFRRNRGLGWHAPGAISVSGIGATDILNSLFIENVGGYGATGAAGAVRFDETNHGPSTIVGCTFERNVGGGGRQGGPGAVRSQDGGVIVDCDFIENRGGDSFRGDAGAGALQCDNHSTVEVDSCRFLDNVGGSGATDQSNNPNAADSGAGGIGLSGNRPRIRNCVLARNIGGSSVDYAAGAGAIELQGGEVFIANCTVVDNVAGTGQGTAKPAGLRTAGGAGRTVINSIFWNDTGAPELVGGGPIRFCIVRGGHPGNGNLDLEPLLADPAGDDFHLLCASPGRDAGTLDVELAGLDYEGDPRHIGAAVDIGADEYSLAPAGLTYCVSTPNSTGAAALIDARGCNVLADGILPLHASPVPDTFGAFFYGTAQLQTPFGNGVRCVGGAIFRLPFVAATGGELFDTLDYANPPRPAGQITAGSTWYFQAFFRDPAAGGAQVDLTDGLQITFVP